MVGKFDPLIDWLRTQMTQAAEARALLCAGQAITAEWIARYDRMISRCEELISAYSKRNRYPE
jgi:hypothetical protein